MTNIFIIKNFCIEPKNLNSNVKSHIFEKIKTELIGKCEDDYGYISNIYDDIEILSNSISSAGIGIFFNVKFRALVIKPEIKKIYRGKVFMIFSNGIFVQIFEKMKVLIPLDNLKDYKFDSNSNCFVKNKKTISKNDIVDVEINMMKYEKQNFNCIGSLKN